MVNFIDIETRRLVQKRKTVSKACKIGLYPPNWTLPVNNTVKKGRINSENLKLFAQIDGFVNKTRYVSGIGYVKRTVIEWAQRICSEKELFWEVVKGKSKKIRK
jgi:hypothetical protein